MVKPLQRHVIREEKQMKALVSAARQEVVDVMADLGTVSVAEIAAALGRPADALYFHIRALLRAGLVRQVGSRRRGGRLEALYRTVSPELFLHYDPASPRNRRAVTAIVSSMLRLGVRDFRRGFGQAGIAVSGPQRELWAWRKAARLTLPQVAALNRQIQDLARSMSRPKGKGRLYGLTVLLVPLDRPGSTRKTNSTAPRRRKQ